MARPPRLQILDGIYHLTARGNERTAIFRDDADRRHFLELVADVRERYHWRIFSYCLMSNHYHLLVQTPEPNLARGMRQLNGVYAFVASTLKRLEPAPGVPRRYLQAPRPALPILLATCDADTAIASAHEHGYSLREIARYLGVNASTISRRLKRRRGRSRSATNGT